MIILILNTGGWKAVTKEAEDMFSSYYRCYFDKYFNISSNSTNPDR